MKTCLETWQLMSELSAQGAVRNFTQEISMTDYTVETDMFPIEVLEAYSSYNLGHPIPKENEVYFNSQRGGKQGDYRDGMQEKIANVVDCLKNYPESKRAVITIPNNSKPSHQSDDDAKCMREIHFYREGNKLCASVLFRAQAAQIFPKNIHFIGALMSEVAGHFEGLGLGSLFYHSTVLVSDRS